jgi:hypothetical protein
MAIRYKVLGQKSVTADTEWNLYTVNGTKDAVVSSIVVANRDPDNAAKYRIAVRQDNATLTNDMYIAYDIEINPATSIGLSLGITMNTDDVLTVRANSSSVTFSAFGTEIDA